MEDFQTRIKRYITEYNERMWPDLPNNLPSEDWEFDVIEVHAEHYASAHVDGEHEEFKTCPYATAEECGERSAAETYAETH